jgi:hypothetical protein
VFKVDRLGEQVVHAGSQAALAILRHAAGGDGDNWAPCRIRLRRWVASSPSMDGMWTSIRIKS